MDVDGCLWSSKMVRSTSSYLGVQVGSVTSVITIKMISLTL